MHAGPDRLCMTPVRLIALYLPQFHPVPENNEWWGPGFTEWTNTAKARRLYPGHYQPHVPADLGFYDLRVPETRPDQADLARAHGIEAFCYYHYWFAGTTGSPAGASCNAPSTRSWLQASRTFRFACAGRTRPGAASGTACRTVS
jgi:hypothetical protein